MLRKRLCAGPKKKSICPESRAAFAQTEARVTICLKNNDNGRGENHRGHFVATFAGFPASQLFVLVVGSDHNSPLQTLIHRPDLCAADGGIGFPALIITKVLEIGLILGRI